MLFVWSANKLKSLLLIHMFDGIQLFPVKTDGANNFITHVSCLQAHLSIHHMMINAYFFYWWLICLLGYIFCQAFSRESTHVVCSTCVVGLNVYIWFLQLPRHSTVCVHILCVAQSINRYRMVNSCFTHDVCNLFREWSVWCVCRWLVLAIDDWLRSCLVLLLTQSLANNACTSCLSLITLLLVSYIFWCRICTTASWLVYRNTNRN